MPESRLLVVAVSARALAFAAWRAGFAPVVLDLFGDSDMRRIAATSAVVPGDLAGGFKPEALIAAAERIAPAGSVAGVVYGSGLESTPGLISALAEGRTLYGNAPEAVRRVKDPAVFFPPLDRLGLAYPEITERPPAEPAGWLAKRAGAAGGAHVVPAGQAAGRGIYYQRRSAGSALALLFAADGRQGRALAYSAQWPSPAPGAPFRFGGAAGPISPPPALAARVETALNPLVTEFGLRGLNSLDMLWDGAERVEILEINPRPGAALDVFDGPGLQSLGALHLASCAGALDHPWSPSPTAIAMEVVYADAPLAVPPNPDWPPWLADRPAPLAQPSPGAPVCTVRAQAADATAARALADERRNWVLQTLACST